MRNHDIDGNESNNKKRISRVKLFKGVLFTTLAAGGIVICGVACNSNNKQDNKDSKTKQENNEDMNIINPEKVTTAIVDNNGKIQLEENSVDDSIKNDEISTSHNISEENINENYEVNRVNVTSDDVTKIVKDYYSYLNERVEDSNNNIEIGELYSTVWMANSQFITAEQTNIMIENNLIPSDLTTLKTEVDNVMSLIISENASKVAVADAFDTELDVNKLISVENMFIDKEDKLVADYCDNQYMKLIAVNDVYDESGNIVTSKKNMVLNIYENTRNFFNNATKYEFSEISNDSKYFRHDYPVNFTQTSIGAQYLIKGIMGPEFIIYATSTGAVGKNESIRFQETIDNVEGSISYLDDKFNGICFNNETIKTYVKQ